MNLVCDIRSGYRKLTLQLVTTNGNDIKTKAERSFGLGFVFVIEAKRTCLFQNLKRSKRSGANSVYSTNWKDRSEAKSVYSTNLKDRRGANSVYSTNWKDQREAKSVYSTNSKDRSEANSYSRNRQDRSEKNELDRSKTNRGGIFINFMEHRNQFQGIDSASLCPGGPVKQPYSSSVPSPLRMF